MSYVLCLCGERCHGEDNLAAHDALAEHIERVHGSYRGRPQPSIEIVQARSRKRSHAHHRSGHPTTDSR